MLYVKDVVEGLRRALRRPGREDDIEDVQHGADNAPTAGEFVAEVKKHFPDARITFKPDPSAEAVLKSAPKTFRSYKAEQEWGWKFSDTLSGMWKTL